MRSSSTESSEAEAREILAFYRSELDGYTYLEPEESAVMSERQNRRVFFDLPAQRQPIRAGSGGDPAGALRPDLELAQGRGGGPDAILEASQYVEVWDLETSSEPWRSGIGALAAARVRRPSGSSGRTGRASGSGGFLPPLSLPVVLGGEHSVTIGAVRAAAAAFPRLSVLQIDAHADTRESYGGSTHSHACVMARVREVCPIVQVGIRSVDRTRFLACRRTA